MVKIQLTSRTLLLWLALVCSLFQPAWAENLEASVDRTQISENESLTLTVTGTMDVNFSFNIFNFSLPSPDLEPLGESFEIVDQRQRYNFQNINGRNQASVTWTYTLIPKQSGTLTIPSLKFKDAESAPIKIEVTPQQAGAQKRDSVFLEAEVSKQKLYVQEQLIYTLRLNYQDNIVSGDLTAPELPDAVVKQIDDQKEYSRIIDGRRYDVIERRYVILPQTSGTLEIEPQLFTGTLYDSRLQDRRYIKAASAPLNVEVLPPPANKQGDVWLPAMSLSLTEHWSRTPDQLDVGDSVTRTLTIKALGLEGSQLPPLPSQDVPELKQYPEQPQIETETHGEGVTGTRIERTALVAVKSGEIQLPEIRLPWWDTLNNEWREAVIPARTIRIGDATSPQADSATAPKPMAQEPPQSAQKPGGPPTVETVAEPSDTNARFWQGVSLVLLTAWLATLALWILQRRRKDSTLDFQSGRAKPQTTSEEEAFHHLSGLSEKDWNQVRPALLSWARAYWPRHSIHSLAELLQQAQSPELSQRVQALEAAHYSEAKPPSGADVKSLVEEVRHLRARHPSPPTDTQSLAALYPSPER